MAHNRESDKVHRQTLLQALRLSVPAQHQESCLEILNRPARFRMLKTEGRFARLEPALRQGLRFDSSSTNNKACCEVPKSHERGELQCLHGLVKRLQHAS